MNRIVAVLLLVLLAAGPLAGADRVRYVDTGSSGGDGTTPATSGANAAYASLSACLTTEYNNDATLTDEGNLVIHLNRTNGGGADTTAATIVTGWGTDTTHRVVIVQDDFPTDAIYNSAKYVLQPTDTTGLTVQDKFVTVGPLQINPVETGTGIARGININTVGASSDIRIQRCIIKGSCAGTGEGYGIYINDSAVIVKIYNCLILDIVSGSDTDFRGIRAYGNTTSIYNCTVYNCRYGIYLSTGGTVTATNCAVGNNYDDFLNVTTVTNCCSDDGDGTDPQSPSGGDWANEFANLAGGDFRLKSGGNCIDHGVTDPGSGLYSTDILGTTRSGAWDIGAFEYASGGGGGGAKPWYYYANQ